MRVRRVAVAFLSLTVSLAACSSSSARETTLPTDASSSSVETTTSSSASTTSADSTVPATASTAATPSATNPPATSPPATSSTPSNEPVIQVATFSEPGACPATDVSVALPQPSVSISWVAVNADYVYVAIDNPEGPYETNLPLTGSISDLPFGGCPATHTYYVVAVKGALKDIVPKVITVD